jgi:hypothetical protein
MPMFWVSVDEIEQRIKRDQKWSIVFRDIARSTDERTCIFSIIPMSGIGNNAPLFNIFKPISLQICCFGNLSTICLDFIGRLKAGGTHLNFYIVKQIAVLPPSTYSLNIKNYIIPRVTELTYTAWDLEPFAQDILEELGPDSWNQYFPYNPLQEGRPHPFRWDEDRRAVLRAELDAIYAKLYGLTKDELEYILTTFPVLKKNEEKQFGEYRTGRLVMEAWERMEGKI